jgi:hypothetical protein
MLHALLGGFAATIGVLLALHVWGRVAEWRERRAFCREVHRHEREAHDAWLQSLPPTPPMTPLIEYAPVRYFLVAVWGAALLAAAVYAFAGMIAS